MKATVVHEFDGCFSGCPYCSEASMGPNYCYHPEREGDKERLIIGYCTSSSNIPKGKKHPDWCPIAKQEATP